MIRFPNANANKQWFQLLIWWMDAKSIQHTARQSPKKMMLFPGKYQETMVENTDVQSLILQFPQIGGVFGSSDALPLVSLNSSLSHTVDGRNPAPSEKPWIDDSPVNTKQKKVPRGFSGGAGFRPCTVVWLAPWQFPGMSIYELQVLAFQPWFLRWREMDFATIRHA